MKKTKISLFTNRYTISKTLRFSLLPVGKTYDTFVANKLLDEDEQRAKDYSEVKKIIDDYHKYYIDLKLSNDNIVDVHKYAGLYYKSNKTERDKKELEALEKDLRSRIAAELTNDKIYGSLSKRELFSDILPGFVGDDPEKRRLISSFDSFVTYFSGFFENRKNMYSDEEKATSIAFRCINDNLPRFLDNCRSFEKVQCGLSESEINAVNDEIYALYGIYATDIFKLDYFSFVLSQSGIDKYNQIIGGYTNSDRTKAKGINEIINLYNQKVSKAERLPKLKMLYKQILSDRDSISYIPESFNDDNEVLKAVLAGYNALLPFSEKLRVVFDDISGYEYSGIYVKNENISLLSQHLIGDWSVVSDLWNKEYDKINYNPAKPPKNVEKYYEDRKKAFKNKSFSFDELQILIDKYFAEYAPEVDRISIAQYYRDTFNEIIDRIKSNYNSAESLLTNEYSKTKKLAKNEGAIELIKDLLDSIKELELVIKQLTGSGKEENKDERFYGDILPVYDELREFGRLYDRVRNYVTKKPYSTDKIKLNFQNPQFLNGWDRNKEKDYRSILLKKGDQYYLAIMDRNSGKVFEEFPDADSNGWEKINYKLLPGPNKMLPKVFFAKSNIDFFAPSDSILRIRNEETFKKGEKFSKKDCEELIDFFKASLKNHPEWRDYGFSFRETSSYNDIGEFYNDVRMQGYKISCDAISEEYLMDLVNEGKVYLFQIYNKDFSEHSKGTPNLHTLYFKMLFDERNLRDVVYQLNGGAEMFYRLPSLKPEETTVHKAGEALGNKNALNRKKTSTFGYDIIKDRRFTKPQFSLHMAITLNFKSLGMDRCNADVQKALKNCDDNYVIGIDRGERHLLYISVINGKGEIVEQYSLNKIINEYNGTTYETDYHTLLDRKEKERDEARKNWTSIENIKELKEGYISQAVHKICELVIKYDAVIAMEDLNMGFKNSRAKVDKQVYQKFEKMLIDKLNYLVVDKNMDPEKTGGLLKAYQLTEKFESFKKMGKQNGFIFYVPPYLTSKIDPVTGFVDLLRPKYESVEKSKAIISTLDFVRYNSDCALFEFGLDYSKIERGSISYISKWTVCSNGERINTFRNKSKNNEWDNESVVLTDTFKGLFNKYGIDISQDDLKAQILEQTSSDFFREFIRLLGLTLQMRNSIANSDTDYLISPVRGKNGIFYQSGISDSLPENADANGAYNIARKALWCIEQIKAADDDKLGKVRLAVSNKEWLEYAQKG